MNCPYVSNLLSFYIMPAKTFPSQVLLVTSLAAPFRDIDWRLYPGPWEMGYTHSHQFCQIVYLVKGTTIFNRGTDTTLRAGEFVVFAPGEDHTWWKESSRPAQMLNINMRDTIPGFTEITRALDSVCRLNGGAFTGSDGNAFGKKTREIIAEVREGRFGYKYRITALLMEFLLSALRHGIKDREEEVAVRSVTRLDRVIWYLEQHLAEKLTLEDIAEQVGVTPKHTCDLFKEELGISPVQYLNRIRIERARVLLEDHGFRISEIALLVGIEDEHYFSRLFKKITGITPSQYRSQL